MLLRLDFSSQVPIYRQIRDQIVVGIASGELRPGEKLPAIRALAEQSGVNLRNIQMYEQRVNGIDKAQANILYKLSRVLGCNVEDLLENPMM